MQEQLLVSPKIEFVVLLATFIKRQFKAQM